MLQLEWELEVRRKMALTKRIAATAMEIPAMATVMVTVTATAATVIPDPLAVAMGIVAMATVTKQVKTRRLVARHFRAIHATPSKMIASTGTRAIRKSI
jgi:hypothetical protein